MQTIKELKAWRVAAPDGCALANRDGGHEPYFRRTVVVAQDNKAVSAWRRLTAFWGWTN